MTKVLELFGVSTKQNRADWSQVVSAQQCPFTKKPCFKVRKSLNPANRLMGGADAAGAEPFGFA